LGWAWIDADTVLEERWGRSIRLIFEDEGERGFRAKETAILEELCRSRNQVVATGGGVVLAAANRERLRAAGLVVWLHADAPVLWQRIQSDATTQERRPPLAGGGLAEIQKLFEARKPLYEECADFTVDATERSPDAVADEIVKMLSAERGAQSAKRRAQSAKPRARGD
jgi:shikimate kinase